MLAIIIHEVISSENWAKKQANTKFAYVEFRNIDLAKNIFFEREFHHVKLLHINCIDTIFTNSTFFIVDLTGAVLENTTFTNSKFDTVDLSGAVLKNARLPNSKFDKVDLTGAVLENARLTNATLTKTLIKDAHLDGALLNMAILDEVDFRGASLTGTAFTCATFKKAKNLQPYQLLKATLNSADGDEETKKILAEAYRSQGNTALKEEKQNEFLNSKTDEKTSLLLNLIQNSFLDSTALEKTYSLLNLIKDKLYLNKESSTDAIDDQQLLMEDTKMQFDKSTDKPLEVIPKPQEYSLYKNAANSFLQLANTHSATVDQLEQNPADFKLTESTLFKTAVDMYVSHKKEEEMKEWLMHVKAQRKNFRSALAEKDSTLGLTLPLYFAFRGQHSVYQYLTNHGFDGAAQTKHGFSATHLAILGKQNGFLEKVFSLPQRRLTACEIKVGDISLMLNELHTAIMLNDFTAVKLIFNKIKGIKHDVPHVGSILNLAIIFSDYPMVQFLLHQSYYDNISMRQLLTIAESSQQMEPLALAAHLGKPKIVEYLLDIMLSDVTLANDTEIVQKAFYCAAEAGEDDIMQLFFRYGFKPQAHHPQYNNLITYLTKENYLDILNILKQMLQNTFRIEYHKPDPKTQVYRNIVFQGGGMKGAIYPYALKRLESACQARQTYCEKQLGYEKTRTQDLGMNNIKRVAGTSAGSIFALGFALGVDADALIAATDFDFGNFLDTPELQGLAKLIAQTEENLAPAAAVQKILAMENGCFNDIFKHTQIIIDIDNKIGGISLPNLIKHPVAAKELYDSAQAIKKILPNATQQIKAFNNNFEGFSNGNAIYQWLITFMKAQGIEDPERYTFGDLAKAIQAHQKNYKHLYITVTCLNTGVPVVLNSESPQQEYHDYVILDAIRASMSIPVVFKPSRLARISATGEKAWSEYQFVDGGLLRNYPITEFDRKLFVDTDAKGELNHLLINNATLGFNFETAPAKASIPETLVEFVKRLGDIYYQAENIISTYEDRNYGRTIALDTGNISTLTFKKLTPEDKAFLDRSAQKAIKRYFFEKGSHIIKHLQQWGNPVFGADWESDEERTMALPREEAPHEAARKEEFPQNKI